MLLKKNFEPTDFADADCRVTPWMPFDGYNGTNGYRIWICKCGAGYWFQRHEWTKEGRNSTELDEWLFAGYSPGRTFDVHLIEAPIIEDF